MNPADLEVMDRETTAEPKGLDWSWLPLPALALAFIWVDTHALHAFSRVGHQVMLIESLTPLAAVTVVHATLRNIHPDRAAMAVALSTLFALLWLPIVYSHAL